jgi:hypothetical protein
LAAYSAFSSSSDKERDSARRSKGGARVHVRHLLLAEERRKGGRRGRRRRRRRGIQIGGRGGQDMPRI